MNNLTVQKRRDRRYRVLGHIVHIYVCTGVPVGSKAVARSMGGNVSSATIRNVMSGLEEEGYITHPHTSAGRIPTNYGYRYYVDIVREQINFDKREAERLAAEYAHHVKTMKEVVEKTSFLISRELHNAGIVMWPSIEDFYLKRLELVKVRAETVLAVLVTMTNAVKNHIVQLDRELEATELKRVENYINTHYEEESFSDIADKLRSVLLSFAAKRREAAGGLAKNALTIIDSIVEKDIENEIYWEGLDHFMANRESRDIDVARSMLRIFSERKDLSRLMRKELPYRGLKVYIGNESNCDALKRCSVITCGYMLHGRTVGRIGVIGPTRMDYVRALGAVNCLSDLISAKLDEINR